MAKLNKSTPIEEPLRPKIITFEQGRRVERELPFVGPTEVVELPILRIPQNLPPRGEFIGREKEKAQVREALASRSYLVSIDGIGGIGKTALGLEVAHELWEEQSFEAVIWTTAKDRELTLNDVLDTIARTLNYPYITHLPPEEKLSEAAKLLRQYKCLLIVDNFETITDDAVRDFLLSLPDPSKALITSREQKLRQARAVSLRGMEQGEALALIRNEGKRLGLGAVEQVEEGELLRLYEATGGAPLAIKWAVGQMKQRGQSLDTVLDYLYEARGDVFENIFARSWSLLSENAKCVLMVMPIFATSASKPAIEAASDVHKWDLDEALGQLVEMWLVEASGELDVTKRRYAVHPLTRAFARMQLTKDPDFEWAARLRCARYFLDFAKRYGEYRNWQGLDELEGEHENILGAFDWCYVSEQRKMVIEFGWALSYYLWTRGYWHERIALCKQVVEVSVRENDYLSVGWGAYDIGRTYLEQGKYEEVRRWGLTAKEAMEKAEYPRGIAFAMRLLGMVAQREGDYDKAQQSLAGMLEISKQAHLTDDVAIAKTSLGDLAYERGDYEEARQWYKEVLVIGRELGNQEIIAISLNDLGNVAIEQYELDEARSCYEEGLEIAHRVGVVEIVARCKFGLARVEEQAANHIQARTLAQEALEHFERLGMRNEIEKTRELVERLEGKLSADG